MNKTTSRSLIIIVILVLLSLVIFAKNQSTKTAEITNDQKESLSSQKQKPQPIIKLGAPDDKTIHIFTGTLLEKISDEKSGTLPAQQFKIRVSTLKLAPDVTNDVRGDVIVNSNDPNIKLYKDSSLTYKFYATYNSNKNWYEIIRLNYFIAD